MTTINVDQLGNAKGLNKELAANIAGVYETYEELALATPEDLVATVDGLSKTTATAAITFAKIKVKATQTNQPAAAEEEVKVVSTATAPPGTTAVMRLLRRSGDLARQLGLPEARYLGCSYCRNDLEVVAEDEGLRPEQFQTCPYCHAAFVQELKTFCYSCGQKMTTGGNCVNCGATTNDDYPLKAMTVLVRKEQGTNGRIARATAQSLLADKGYTAQIVARAKAEKWVEKAEEGQSSTMPPFGSTTGGGNPPAYQTPANLPRNISLPEHVLYANVLTTHLSRAEMHELTQQVGERPGSICSGDREDKTYARELVGHLSRRSRVYELIEALYRLHPRVNWAAELGLVEKAGDVVHGSKFTFDGADLRGAQVNVNSTFFGDGRK